MWQCLLPIIGEAGFGGFGPFFQNAHFVYVINIVKTLWVRKITMF